MIPIPNNRAVKSGGTVTRDGQHHGGAVVGASHGPTGTVRKPATIRDVLGRDPKASVRAGADGLLAVPSTINSQPSTDR